MEQIIKSKDYRVTGQREIILDEIKKDYSHPSANQIFEKAKARIPNLGIATVYRTLDFLLEKNLIKKIESKNRQTRYDGITNGHCHLICKKCGRVVDILDVKNIKINSSQIQKEKFQIDLDFVEFHGLCENCKI